MNICVQQGKALILKGKHEMFIYFKNEHYLKMNITQMFISPMIGGPFTGIIMFIFDCVFLVGL